MIEEAINLINQSLKSHGINGDFYGVSELVPVVSEDITYFHPKIIDKDGECIAISLSNTTNIQIYYRLTFSTSAVDKSQFGSTNKDTVDTYSISMYVSADRTRIRSSAIALKEKISQWIPDIIKENGRQIATIVQGNCDFNSNQIIGAEFPNTEYSGMPNIFMYRQDFQIRHSNKRKCVEVCQEDCKNYSTN